MLKRHDIKINRGLSNSARTGCHLPTGQFRDKNPDDMEGTGNLPLQQQGSPNTLVAIDSPDDF